MEDGLFTNRNSRRDFVVNAVRNLSQSGCTVKIASAFFTDEDMILEMARSGCQIRLVVRLGYPTSSEAIRKVMSNDRVQIRFFTDRTFHPKLYIFGDNSALVGSANMTRSALIRNQEIMLLIKSDDVRFDELAVLFSEYWSDSKVMNESDLQRYEATCKEYEDTTNQLSKFADEVETRIGRIVSHNITRDIAKVSKENQFNALHEQI